MDRQKIGKVEVSLVASPVQTGFQDATRKVETVGMCVVRLTTEEGMTGIGVTYHEVGGEAIRELIERYYAPKIIGRLRVSALARILVFMIMDSLNS